MGRRVAPRRSAILFLRRAAGSLHIPAFAGMRFTLAFAGVQAERFASEASCGTLKRPRKYAQWLPERLTWIQCSLGPMMSACGSAISVAYVHPC